MGKIRILDLAGARQISNPTGPAMGKRIGAAVKDLGELLAGEFVFLPPDKGKVYSDYWRTIRGDEPILLLNPFFLLLANNRAPKGAMHFADIRFKPHWYIPSKIVVTLIGREWEDSVFIDARCPELLGLIKRAADKFVTLPGTPDVNVYATDFDVPSRYVRAGNTPPATA